MQVAWRIISAFWFGGALFLLAFAAPAAFKGSPTSTAAANVVGAMLSRWHYIAVAAPVLLLLLQRQQIRGRMVALLFAAIVLAVCEIAVDRNIARIRTTSAVPISELSRSDPIRRRFGMLHGVSSLLLLLQIGVAGAVVALGPGVPKEGGSE
ncbi:MAG TPA: DUF4149 domain-containing protein [Thermoanaerobaculia bacterium]|nr:DUF4149 domain-containing protein [Thermoanaerobaculia bacterium]